MHETGSPPSALHLWSAREIAAAVQRREVSANEVVRHHLDRIVAHETLNAFVTVDVDGALERARALDRAGASLGLLAGVPLAPKDSFDTAGLRTTYGSQIFAQHVPTATAPAVQRLVDAGAVIVGKANLNEFARGVTTANPFFGHCQNPRRPGFTPSGSSGGNAAALAAGLVALGLATDAGGSIRGPAAACGVVGYKPAYRRIQLTGSFPLAESFDHAGPMARTVGDCLLAMEALVDDPPMPEPRLHGLRIGVTHPLPAAVGEGLEGEGARLEEVTIPSFAHLIAFHLAEFAYTHRELYPARADEYTPEARAMLDLGREVSAVEYRRLGTELAAWRRQCDETLLYDVLASPAIDGDPPRLDQPENHDLLLRMSHLTRPYNLLGWPAITCADGTMLAGRSERTVLGAALAWEQVGHQAVLVTVG